jgi:NAD(P)-dependent dehydrogenase (short-subunit alcohol dehydrogenase family)
LWDFAVETFGKVDSWVNNAGISLVRKPLAESDPADFEKIVRINLLGAMNGTHVALTGMQAQGSGDIWNMEGFGSGGQKAEGLSPYGSTKRALTYFTNAIAKELKDGPVQIHHLSPGIVVTDLLIGDYAEDPEGFEKAKRIFNILGDKVETVTPYLADGILNGTKNGGRVAWLSGPKAAGRFATAAFKQRDLFEDVDVPTASK